MAFDETGQIIKPGEDYSIAQSGIITPAPVWQPGQISEMEEGKTYALPGDTVPGNFGYESLNAYDVAPVSPTNSINADPGSNIASNVYDVQPISPSYDTGDLRGGNRPADTGYIGGSENSYRGSSKVVSQVPSPGGGGKNLKRPSWDTTWKGFTFKYFSTSASNIPASGKILTLFVNPEDFTQNEPPRLTVIQTKGGAAVTNFGQGLKQISIRGVTGYWRRKGTGIGPQNVSGHEHFLDLRAIFRAWEKEHADNPGKNRLEFYNWADEEAFEIVPNGFSLTRSVSRPLLYQYNISFTAIKNLGDKQFRGIYDSVRVNYTDEERPDLLKNSLNKQLDKINKRIKNKGPSNLADNAWGSWIGKGGQFLNKATNLWMPVTGVINQVKNLSLNINTFASGATNFITMPFEIVKGMANSISNVVASLSAVANVPHEICRAFNEMKCAINTIPEAWFKGFTNPSLFDGASNCGTTVGILPAPVETYSNSFTATSVKSSLVPISETFNQVQEVQLDGQTFTLKGQPQGTLSLKEYPIQISGVFLMSDLERTGENFLSSSSGTNVILTQIPSGPVVVDYVALNPMESNIVRLNAATSRIVKLGDTLERIALETYGDASAWKHIAVFNDLEYPFIATTPTFDKEIYATGKVRFYRQNGYTSDIVIPENYYVYVPYQAIIGTEQLDFTVDINPSRDYYSDSTMEVPHAIPDGSWVLKTGKNYIDIPVTAVYYGEIGNVASNITVGPYGDSTWGIMNSTFQSTYYKITGVSKISNLSSMLGGKIWKILVMGDIIQIPQEATAGDNFIVGAKQDYNELFGVDIRINKNGEIDSVSTTSKDLRLVSGIQNLVQALRDRLATTRGFYVYHDNYGTYLPIYIGMKNTPYWDGLIKWDITTAVLLDPRIADLESLKMIIYGDSVTLDFNAIPINEKTSIPINMIV